MHNADETHNAETDTKGETERCPSCHCVGYHGPVHVQGPPWNPWGTESHPCPKG
jgi:hypothetical protein